MAAPSAQVWLRFLAQVALEAANAGVDWRVESTEFARVVALASRHSMTDRWSDDTSEGARAQPKDNASCVAQGEFVTEVEAE